MRRVGHLRICRVVVWQKDVGQHDSIHSEITFPNIRSMTEPERNEIAVKACRPRCRHHVKWKANGSYVFDHNFGADFFFFISLLSSWPQIEEP